MDLETSVREYIASEYKQVDAGSYTQDCASLQKLRNEVRHAAYSTTWRDALYRYLVCLDYIIPKFCGGSHGEASLGVGFTWEDTFTLACVEQKSFAHEKAGVLFNLAAVCSGVGCAQNREAEEGLKKAYIHFQLAAGILDHIGDKFMYPATLDSTSEAISMLSTLQLAQAQECMLEKAMSASKAPSLVAKLSSQLEQYYDKIIGLMESSNFKCYVRGAWLIVSKIKLRYFGLIASYYQGLHHDSQKNYGVSVGYFNSAISQIKALKKIAQYKKAADLDLPKEIVIIPQNRSSARTQSADLYASPNAKEYDKLIANCNSLIKIVELKVPQAVKDNNLVYHQQVPATKELEKIAPLVAAKPEPFQAFFSKALPGLTTEKPLFAGLVTESVRNAVSQYIGRRNTIVNEAVEMSDKANAQLHDSLESSDMFSILPGVIDIVLNSKSMKDCIKVDTEALKDVSVQVKSVLQSMDSTSPPLKLKVRRLIDELKLSADEISRLLSEDDARCSIMKAKYLSEWTQSSLSQYDYDLLQASESCVAEVSSFADDYKKLSDTIDNLSSVIEVLKSIDSVKNDIIQRSILASDAANDIRSNDLPGVIFSSHDTEVGSPKELKDMILTINEQLECLKDLKAKRLSIVEDLKKLRLHDKVEQDALLSAESCKDKGEDALKEYEKMLDVISSGVKKQKTIVKNILSILPKFESRPGIYRTFSDAQNKSKELVKSYILHFEQWKEAVNKLKVQHQHLESLKSSANNTRSKLSAAISYRTNEANMLQSRIQYSRETASEESVKKMLDNLSLTIRPHSYVSRSPSYPPEQGSVQNTPYPQGRDPNVYQPNTNVPHHPHSSPHDPLTSFAPRESQWNAPQPPYGFYQQQNPYYGQPPAPSPENNRGPNPPDNYAPQNYNYNPQYYQPQQQPPRGNPSAPYYSIPQPYGPAPHTYPPNPQPASGNAQPPKLPKREKKR